MPSILLVEDDRWLAELYSNALATVPRFDIKTVASAGEAFNVLDTNYSVDLIILDMMLPDHNGVEFLHEIASYEDIGSVPIIVLSSIFKHDFPMPDERWKQYGVIDYLYKPDTRPEDLISRVKKHFVKAKM